jgi:hypothetical protein
MACIYGREEGMKDQVEPVSGWLTLIKRLLLDQEAGQRHGATDIFMAEIKKASGNNRSLDRHIAELDRELASG